MSRQQASEAELVRLRDENQRLAAMATTSLPALVAALEKNTNKGSSSSRSLVDIRGMGKPPVFKGTEEDWPEWAGKFANYLSAVHEDADTALEWAEERTGEIQEADIDDQFGDLADDNDKIENIGLIDMDVYRLLLQYMNGESYSIVKNTRRGRGLEAYRRLARRFDPATGGRRLNMLRTVLQPGRTTLDQLAAALERWEEQLYRYERFKNENGTRSQLTDDVKLAALISMAPEELERHLQLNGSRFGTYLAAREKVRLFVETRLGLRIKNSKASKQPQQQQRNGGDDRDDAMDCDSFVPKTPKGGKGKGKGGNSKGKPDRSKSYFDGACHRCGKWGHRSADCYSGKTNGGQQQQPSTPSSSSNSKPAKGKKGKGKGKGKKSAAGLDADAEEPEVETSNLDAQMNAISGVHKNVSTNSNVSTEETFSGLSSYFVGERAYEVVDDEGKTWIRHNLDSGAGMSAFPPGLGRHDHEEFSQASSLSHRDW